ncbi:MAG: hypothetical protein WC956_09195 [bacterium]
MPWKGKDGSRLYFYPIDGTLIDSGKINGLETFNEARAYAEKNVTAFATTVVLPSSGQVVWVGAAPTEMQTVTAAFATNRGRYMSQAEAQGLVPGVR